MFLTTIEFFKDQTVYFFEKLLKLFQTKSFIHGDIILKQGEPIDYFYIIRRGKFSVEYTHKNKVFIDFGIGYFKDINDERFTSNRNSEIKGSFNADEILKVKRL